MLTGSAGIAQTVLTNNNGIIRNSLCVGFDCANNESFGFDTIRLKEDNVRIAFVDTSTVTGFPTRDWHLTANSPSSGGQSYFGIRDCGNTSNGEAECGTRVFSVQATAPSESIFVASTGRVGFRTAVPILDLHVRTGDTPGQRLEQDGSSGFSPQTWDIAGNEANFFVRDVTSGSRLPFRIRPGAPTSSIDIRGNGNIGIGTASPNAKLHVVGGGTPITPNTATVSVFQRNAAENDAAIMSIVAGASSSSQLAFGSAANELSGRLIYRHFDQSLATEVNGTETMRISSVGNVGIGTNEPTAQLHTTGTIRFAGLLNCSSGIVTTGSGNLACSVSSMRFKTITGVLSADVALANVMALRPQVGAYKATPDVPEHWLIAEDVAAVDRALVGLHEGRPYVVKTQNVVADLVAVVQEQQRRIEVLEREIGTR